MSAPQLTRRSLLTVVAGSGALAAVAPGWLASTAEALTGGVPRVYAIVIGDLPAGTHSVAAPAQFDLAGLQWAAPVAPGLLLRTNPGGAWANAAATGHAPDRAVTRTAHYGDPVWTGPAHTLQLRATEPMRGVVVHFVASPPLPAEAVAAALPLAEPVLAAGPGQPPIVARSGWAAEAAPPPRGGAGYGAVRLGFVHHTENPNGYSSADVPAMLRAIWLFHVQVRGWRDIGYNFVIDRFGRTFEARAGGIDEPVVGAQAGGYNLVSTGVAILGDFDSVPASPAALSALEQLLAWKLSLHGVPTSGHVTVRVDPLGADFSRYPGGALVVLPRIAGHRDADATDCPGDVLYARLPGVRRQAGVLAGRPLVATLTAPTSALTAPGLVALTGTLGGFDGTPLPGVAVALQSRDLTAPTGTPLETTIATLTTDPSGRFAVSLPISFNAALRALFAGGSGLPATVSEPLSVSVAPSLTLSADATAPVAGAPVTLTGTVTPALARVLVTVALEPPNGGPARVSTHHLVVNGGAFAVTFNPQRAGVYRCQAGTPATADSAAGASPVVLVTVT